MLCFIKLFSFLLFLTWSNATVSWDIAVTTKYDLIIFDMDKANFDTIETVNQKSEKVLSRCITFDSENSRLLIASLLKINGTDTTRIYSFSLLKNKETRFNILLELKNQSIQGIEYDSKTNHLLFINDSCVLELSLDGKNQQPKAILNIDKGHPQGIAFDNCRRNIYLTIYRRVGASIDIVSIDNKNSSTIVSGNLNLPIGITIDQHSSRIYWVEISKGVYFKIERANLDGSGRKTLINGRYQMPYGITVLGDFVYYTDTIFNAVWRVKKNAINAEISRSKHYDFTRVTPIDIVSSEENQCENIKETAPIVRFRPVLQESVDFDDFDYFDYML